MPDSALCFASLRDVPALRAKLTHLPLYQLFQKPSVQAFLGEPIRETQEGWKRLEGKLEGITSEFLDCATGEVAVAVLPAGQDAEQTPSFVLVSTVAGRRDDAQTLLERIFQDCRSRGYEERRDEFGSASTVEYFHPDAAEGAPHGESFFASLTDRHLLISNTREGLEQVLAGLLREPSGALAAQVDYRRARQALGEGADGFLYVNLAAVGAWWEEESPPEARGPRLARALGLDQVRVLALAGGIQASDLWLGAYAAPASTDGLLGLFPAGSAGHQLPSWVPGDALDYIWCNLDFGLLWQTVNATLRSLSPPDYMRFRSLLVIPGPTGEPMLDVERDLISPLGQGIWAYTRPRAESVRPAPQGGRGKEAESAPKPAGLEVAVGLGLKDGQALADGVERLRLAGVPPLSFLQPREFLGQRLYTLELGSWLLFFAPSPGPAAGPVAHRSEQPNVTAVLALGIFRGLAEGDRLIIAQRLETLEDVTGRIASGPGAVLRPERLQRAMGRAPAGPGTFLVIYNDLQGYARALGTYVRSRQEVPTWVGFSPLALLGGFKLQPGLYPPDEDVLPYLDAMVTAGSWSETSVSVRLLLLAPPGFHLEGQPQPKP